MNEIIFSVPESEVTGMQALLCDMCTIRNYIESEIIEFSHDYYLKAYHHRENLFLRGFNEPIAALLIGTGVTPSHKQLRP